MRAGVSDRGLIYFLITTLKVNNLKLKRVKQNYKMNIQSEGVRKRRGGSTAVCSMSKTLYYWLGNASLIRQTCVWLREPFKNYLADFVR